MSDQEMSLLEDTINAVASNHPIDETLPYHSETDEDIHHSGLENESNKDLNSSYESNKYVDSTYEDIEDIPVYDVPPRPPPDTSLQSGVDVNIQLEAMMTRQ